MADFDRTPEVQTKGRKRHVGLSDEEMSIKPRRQPTELTDSPSAVLPAGATPSIHRSSES